MDPVLPHPEHSNITFGQPVDLPSMLGPVCAPTLSRRTHFSFLASDPSYTTNITDKIDFMDFNTPYLTSGPHTSGTICSASIHCE
jgi:hypothetical protein